MKEKTRMTETTFENKCYILADLWMNYRDDEQFFDFVDYADLALPLAFLLDNALVTAVDQAKNMINEAFVMLLAMLQVNDEGFESLDDLFTLASK